MAITKIFNINQSRGSEKGKYLKQALAYIADEGKTQEGRYVGSLNCQKEHAFENMIATKHKFGKTDKRQAYHIIVSFEEEKLEPTIAFAVGSEFVQNYLGTEYETLYAVHDNTEHTHVHIIFNSVNCLTGKKYRYEKGDWAREIQPITNALCEKYGLSIIDVSMEQEKEQERYKDWNEFRDGNLIWREQIAKDVDECIAVAKDFEEFLQELKKREYEIKHNKYLAIKPKGMQRFCRCKSLGGDYTEERLRQRIVEEGMEVLKSETKEDTEEFPREQSRKPLSGMQKVYYTKVCVIQGFQKRQYSKAYRYREDIRKLHEWNKRYLFLLKYDVQDLKGLEEVQLSLGEKKSEFQKERNRINREKKRYKESFHLAHEMEKLLPAEHSYQDGDDFFLTEHERFFDLEKQLQAKGKSFADILLLEQRLKVEAADNYQKRKAVDAEYKLADKIRSEYETKVLQWYMEGKYDKEQNNEIEQEQPKRK